MITTLIVLGLLKPSLTSSSTMGPTLPENNKVEFDLSSKFSSDGQLSLEVKGMNICYNRETSTAQSQNMRLDFTSSTTTVLLQTENNYLGVSGCNEDDKNICKNEESSEKIEKVDGSDVHVTSGEVSMPLDVDLFKPQDTNEDSQYTIPVSFVGKEGIREWKF